MKIVYRDFILFMKESKNKVLDFAFKVVIFLVTWATRREFTKEKPVSMGPKTKKRRVYEVTTWMRYKGQVDVCNIATFTKREWKKLGIAYFIGFSYYKNGSRRLSAGDNSGMIKELRTILADKGITCFCGSDMCTWYSSIEITYIDGKGLRWGVKIPDFDKLELGSTEDAISAGIGSYYFLVSDGKCEETKLTWD